jgi:FO synthase subunit 2
LRLGTTYKEALKALREVGLDSMSSTAAEILDDDIGRVIVPNKIITTNWWIAIKRHSV